MSKEAYTDVYDEPLAICLVMERHLREAIEVLQSELPHVVGTLSLLLEQTHNRIAALQARSGP